MQSKKKDIQTRRTTASALHKATLEMVRELFPMHQISEEQTIEVTINGRLQTLFVDIVIDTIGVCIECQGRQHGEFVKHFHRTTQNFVKAQERDSSKADAIREAGLSLVCVYQDEKLTKAQLSKKILAALKQK